MDKVEIKPDRTTIHWQMLALVLAIVCPTLLISMATAGVPSTHLALLIGLAIGTLIGVIGSVLVIRSWVRSYRSRKADPPPSDRSVPKSVESEYDVGPAVEEFRAGKENAIAGVIMAACVAAGGAVFLWVAASTAIEAGGELPLHAMRGKSWLFIGFCIAFGIGGVIGAWSLLRYALGLWSRRVIVCEGGLRFVYWSGERAIPWDRLEGVLEAVRQEYFPLGHVAKHLMPMGKSREYLVRRDDGWEVEIDGNVIRRVGRFGQLMERMAERHQIEWQIVRLK